MQFRFLVLTILLINVQNQQTYNEDILEDIYEAFEDYLQIVQETLGENISTVSDPQDFKDDYNDLKETLNENKDDFNEENDDIKSQYKEDVQDLKDDLKDEFIDNDEFKKQLLDLKAYFSGQQKMFSGNKALLKLTSKYKLDQFKNINTN